MRRGATKTTRRPQPTPEAMVTALLNLIETKFYKGFPVNFAKDKSRLLQMVVLWPATWLNERGVTLPTDAYSKVLRDIIIQAAAHFDGPRVKYLPAWLGRSVEAHFEHHGDEIYERAKTQRDLTEGAIAFAKGQIGERPGDPVRDLATMRMMLLNTKGNKLAKKTTRKAVVNDQLSLI